MSEREGSGRRGLDVAVAVAIAVGAVGIVRGVEGTSGDVVPRSTAEPDPTPPQAARSYRDMQERDYGANRALPATWFDSITQRPEFAQADSNDAERAVAVARRAANRAYDGAPPTIPHPVDQLAAPACLVCHEQGARIANTAPSPGDGSASPRALIAPPMPHARYDSCLQCHVVARDPRPVATTPPAPESSFVGARSAPTERAWGGAPPVTPHPTAMRERCESCHGPFGALGIRPNHPWRASCQQCHPPSAALDQRASRGRP